MPNIEIEIENGKLNGILQIPEQVVGLTLFAHGSGSSRLSSRNQFVAKQLNEAGIATLLFDLLTQEEENIDEYSREHRFNIPLLTSRLLGATDWILHQPQTQNLPLSYFGASTGAAAALQAAALKSIQIKSIVSRGGRPDLAKHCAAVTAPTLLIVGELDEPVIEMNQHAMQQMSCITQLAIVPHATHLFEEPGTLQEVARLAKAWLLTYFAKS